MRKLISYFITLGFLSIIGFTILHPSFRILSDWLGPLMGSHIYTMFTFFYLLFGNPIKYPSILLTWLILGVLVGVISNKKIGSIITVLAVWFTTIAILAGSITGIYYTLEAKGVFEKDSAEILTIIPTVPEQLTFNKLLQTPVFGNLLLKFLQIVPTLNDTDNPLKIMFELLNPYILFLFSKPLIIILGALLGATLAPKLYPFIENVRANRKILTSILITIFLIYQPIHTLSALNVNDGIYTELIGGYIEEQGRAILGQLILGNQIDTVQVNQPEAEGLIASIMLTQKISDPMILYSFSNQNLMNYIHLMNVLPSTLAVNIYLGTELEVNREKSSHIISDVEQRLKLEFHEIITIPITNENDAESTLPEMTLVLYYSNSDITESTENILFGFEDEKGFTGILKNKFETEFLDIELYARGFFIVEPFKEMLPIPQVPLMYQTEYNELVNSKFSFIAGVQLVNNGLEQDSNYFNLRRLMGVNTIPEYASISDGSFIIMSRSNETGIENYLDPTVHIKTSIPENSIDLIFLTYFLQNLGVIEFESGSPTDSDARLYIPEIVQPKTIITKSSQMISEDELEVTLTVTNNENKVIKNAMIKDNYARKYSQTLGKSFSSWASIDPGESTRYTYSVNIKNPGVYTDSPAILTYFVDGRNYTTCSNTVQNIEKIPYSVNMLYYVYHSLNSLANFISNGRGYLLTLTIVLFTLSVVTLDIYRYVRKKYEKMETT